MWLLLPAVVSGQTQHAPVQVAPTMAYEAVFKGYKGADVTLWYDRGKYAKQYGDKLEVCDDAHPPARWSVDLKTKTAQIDFQVGILTVVQMIKRDGVNATARKFKLDKIWLQRFAQLYRKYKPRNLDHVLWPVRPSDPAFPAAFERAGTETVADRLCDIYRSTRMPGRTLWVDRSTLYVLKDQVIYTADNPRRVPTNAGDEVVRFRPLHSVDAAHFQIPPDITAVLPRCFADITLPVGVKRRVMTGEMSLFGFDAKRMLREDEQRERQMHRAKKAKEQ